MNLKFVGRPISRVDGPDKVSGNTVYTADVQLPGMLWGKCLRSPYAHARIISINTEAAKKVKGVRAVLTGEDLPDKRVGLSLQDTPLLAIGKVRFIGEKVVAVAAEDRDAAEEAVSAIEIEYQELPGVFDASQAMTPGVPLVHEDLAKYAGFKAPGDELPNVFASQKWTAGDISTGFDEADLVVEHTFRTAVAHQAYLEPHSAIVA